ncbi:hypothetical protein [Plantactinospora sp. KLBMP9567]|uniref:hypothetical protein n=1 Tax=Plantactinospora sp. KLBMP9567 TaxID=3085900 RepID=UPI002981B3E0|nr:hypothetical protein [Plantactinospora sp. KLBMP9567]MDW5328033.1 hypothetical protein [Plantactinospora sp. KLBMP9567]
MIDPQRVREAVANAGFAVEGFVELPGLPTPVAVWKPFILFSATPIVRVPHADADADARLDNEWARLSARNGTIGADGKVLLSIEGAGRLPWLKVRVGSLPPRPSAVVISGQARDFVALSPDGRASTCVSSEEWETWILANPEPPEDAQV